MSDQQRKTRHSWHVGINRTVWPDNAQRRDDAGWMYTAKDLAEESTRLPFLFERERTGKLRQIHRQCSYDNEGTPIADNHLTCCLGVECRKCEFLLALEKNIPEVAAEEMDKIKAWTCIAHILSEDKGERRIDTSEGMILTTDDRMFWDRVYSSMAGDEDDNAK